MIGHVETGARDQSIWNAGEDARVHQSLGVLHPNLHQPGLFSTVDIDGSARTGPRQEGGQQPSTWCFFGHWAWFRQVRCCERRQRLSLSALSGLFVLRVINCVGVELVNTNYGGACRECGVALTGYQYCVNCGHDALTAAPADEGAPASPPEAAHQETAQEGAEPQEAAQQFAAAEQPSRTAAEQIASLVLAQTSGNAPSAGSGLQLSAPKEADDDPAPLAATSSERTAGLGTALGALTSTDSATATVGSSEVQRRRRLPLILAGTAAVLLAGLFLGRLLGEETPAADVTATEQASASVKPSSTPSTEPSPSAAATGAAAEVADWRCLDGSTSATRMGCEPPTGIAGLSWVFPSFKEAGCSPVRGAIWPTSHTCIVATKAGKATVRYHELPSVRGGVAYFSRIHPQGLVAQNSPEQSQYVWCAEKPNKAGVWRAGSMYVHKPWAVEIEAKSLAATKAALALVEFRDAVDLRAVRITN